LNFVTLKPLGPKLAVQVQTSLGRPLNVRFWGNSGLRRILAC
jgi:hypothetical protein